MERCAGKGGAIEDGSLMPVVFFPLIGGILIQRSSYSILFAITSLFLLGAFILSFSLKEPRRLCIDIIQSLVFYLYTI